VLLQDPYASPHLDAFAASSIEEGDHTLLGMLTLEEFLGWAVHLRMIQMMECLVIYIQKRYRKCMAWPAAGELQNEFSPRKPTLLPIFTPADGKLADKDSKQALPLGVVASTGEHSRWLHPRCMLDCELGQLRTAFEHQLRPYLSPEDPDSTGGRELLNSEEDPEGEERWQQILLGISRGALWLDGSKPHVAIAKDLIRIVQGTHGGWMRPLCSLCGLAKGSPEDKLGLFYEMCAQVMGTPTEGADAPEAPDTVPFKARPLPASVRENRFAKLERKWEKRRELKTLRGTEEGEEVDSEGVIKTPVKQWYDRLSEPYVKPYEPKPKVDPTALPPPIDLPPSNAPGLFVQLEELQEKKRKARLERRVKETQEGVREFDMTRRESERRKQKVEATAAAGKKKALRSSSSSSSSSSRGSKKPPHREPTERERMLANAARLAAEVLAKKKPEAADNLRALAEAYEAPPAVMDPKALIPPFEQLQAEDLAHSLLLKHRACAALGQRTKTAQAPRCAGSKLRREPRQGRQRDPTVNPRAFQLESTFAPVASGPRRTLATRG